MLLLQSWLGRSQLLDKMTWLFIRHSWSLQLLVFDYSSHILYVTDLEVLLRKPYRELSHHTGNTVAGTSEVIAICQSLQQVAEKCQQDPESCWYFHQTAIPCLLALAVQASMPGNFLHLTPPSSLLPTRPSTSVEQHCHPRGITGIAFGTSRGFI